MVFFVCLFAGSLNNKMKERRKEKAVISTVGDILLQRVRSFLCILLCNT